MLMNAEKQPHYINLSGAASHIMNIYTYIKLYIEVNCIMLYLQLLQVCYSYKILPGSKVLLILLDPVTLTSAV
jgi:hypothetical protein